MIRVVELNNRKIKDLSLLFGKKKYIFSDDYSHLYFGSVPTVLNWDFANLSARILRNP